MYLCRQLTNASLPEIGRDFGGKHHTTVLHSIKKVGEKIEFNKEFNSLINNFIDSFQ